MEGEFILSYLGSIGTWYMLEEMLDFFKEVLKIHSNAKFLFITFDEHSRILSEANLRGIGDKIIIQPGQRDEVPTLLSLSTFSIFFIRPTYSKIASSPTKQGELMALGIPIVCNEGVGDTADLVHTYNTGITLSQYNSIEYSSAINKLENTKFDKQKIRLGAIDYFGLEKGIFEKDPDGSVWIDLTSDGLDRKIVLRSDGTAVYMTQDIGTAIQRVKDFEDVGGMVYTVGNEQDYHFKVLFLILKKLGFDWAKNLFHLSYGMVDLPSGKMKSREGTVVDADDLINEMITTAQKISEDLGKLDEYSEQEKSILHKTIGMGALKYYILKVDPKKRILFNPEESVDFAGNTGPFIQYTYARIQSILRKSDFDFSPKPTIKTVHEKEKELVKSLMQFPDIVQDAAAGFSPAIVANYTYDLVKTYNSFYQAVPILPEADFDKKTFRVQLSQKVAETIKLAFSLLGILVPDRM